MKRKFGKKNDFFKTLSDVLLIAGTAYVFLANWRKLRVYWDANAQRNDV